MTHRGVAAGGGAVLGASALGRVLPRDGDVAAAVAAACR